MSNICGQTATYRHLIIEGTSYDVGKNLAEHIYKDKETLRRYYIQPSQPDKKIKKYIYRAIEDFDKYCPGIYDEIRGMAEGLGVEVDELIH